MTSMNAESLILKTEGRGWVSTTLVRREALPDASECRGQAEVPMAGSQMPADNLNLKRKALSRTLRP